jgi:2'-5' RNA ligase
MSLYSVVLLPPKEISEKVATTKQELFERIGDYENKNSSAHITCCFFKAGNHTLSLWENYLRAFALNQPSLSVVFNKTGYFNNGAFFIAANEDSKNSLINLMKQFCKSFPAAAFGKSKVPHITIGRKLDKEQLSIAQTLFSNLELNFNCSTIAIQKYNETIKEYETHLQVDFCLSPTINFDENTG